MKTAGAVIKFEDIEGGGVQYMRIKRVRDEKGAALEVHDGSEHGIDLE